MPALERGAGSVPSCREGAVSSRMRMQQKASKPTMPDITTSPEAWPLPELQRARRAIVVVDVVESVRLMQEDEAGFIERWRRFVHVVRTEVLPKHGGRLVKSLGDGMLLTFETVRAAAAAAFECSALPAKADHPHRRLGLRLGISVGEVAGDELDIYGSEVNLASRLASLGQADDIVASAAAVDQLVNDIDAQIEDLGLCYLKHMAQPVRAFKLKPRAQGAEQLQAGIAVPASIEALSGFAVLTFTVLAAADHEQILGQVVADQLSAALTHSRTVRVISRLSCRALHGRAASLVEAGQLLGARYVVSGTVRAGGSSAIGVWFELADAANGQVVASDVVDTSVAALCDPNSEGLASIARTLATAVVQHEVAQTRNASLVSLPGYALFVGATVLMHRTSRSEFEHSKDMLDHLVQREPRNSDARAWQAKWHILRVVQGWSVDAQLDAQHALDCVRRALEAYDQSALAWAIHGLVQGYLYKDLDQADAAYQQALDFNPNEPLAWLFRSTLQAYRGEGDNALQSSANAMSLSPLDPIRYFFESLAATAALAGQNWQRSIDLARSSLRLNRSHASTWRTLVFALDGAGQAEQARQAAKGLMQVEPNLTVERFKERFPGRGGPLAQPWADALGRAGVPSQ
jgi:adenylate cyclase